MDAPSQIGIVGTGLVGAGFAALAAERAPDLRIRAVEPSSAHREVVAARLPRIDWAHASTDLARCDMVFLACPPDAVVPTARAILAAGPAVVVDMASVKERIVSALSDEARFVGGHPLAGGNRVGPFAADGPALGAARFVLTPHPGNTADTLEAVEALLARLGIAVLRMEAADHDAALARTSHLPHLLSYAFAGGLDRLDPAIRDAVASRSTRDMARFASPNLRMWSEIFRQNADALSDGLDDLILDLMRLRGAIRADDPASLHDRLERAACLGRTLNRSTEE